MTKVELAKMIGLNCDTWNRVLKVDKWQIEDLLQHEYEWIEQTFFDEKIKVLCSKKI